MSCDVGVIGLSVMGANLARNIAENGFNTAVFNRTASKVDDCCETASKENIKTMVGFKELNEFVSSLKLPRKIIMMVEAGPAVDKVLSTLIPLLSQGDLVVDGGNEWYELTERRQHELSTRGLLYVGMGVSGGEEGARRGPAMMIGGSDTAFGLIEPILMRAAARADNIPCAYHVGPGGSGNYVKMVHNGIEYGDMQIIAEVYHVLKSVGKLSNEQLAATFESWNSSELESFLIEITSKIFKQMDDLTTEGHLVDKILDVAGSKGTGKWTVQQAAALGVPCPTIQAALDARYMSTFRPQRIKAAEIFPTTAAAGDIMQNQTKLINDVKNALYCSKICSYSQGFALLQAASDLNGWDLKLGTIARCWKAGCIIRASFLGRISAAFDNNPKLENLLFDPGFSNELKEREASWRLIVTLAQKIGIPIPALSSSLSYFDSYRCDRLPMNLLQAQRDYFGAHTFERIDRPGHFTYRRGEN